MSNRRKIEMATNTPAVHRFSPPIYRAGAIPSLEMVNVVEENAHKENVFPKFPDGSRPGTDLQTFLFVKAWVKNVAYAKNVWLDIHVFDHDDRLIHSATFPLRYLGEAGGNGDFFAFDGKIYQGVRVTPGATSLRAKPDARKVQYRLYYEVNSQLFTDGYFLHQHQLSGRH